MSRNSKEVVPTFESPIGHIRDRIIINESPETEGKIPLGLNGFLCNAQPGIPIDLPRPIRLMLDTRIRTDGYQDEKGKMKYRDVKRYTYTIIKLGVNLNPDGTINPNYLEDEKAQLEKEEAEGALI